MDQRGRPLESPSYMSASTMLSLDKGSTLASGVLVYWDVGKGAQSISSDDFTQTAGVIAAGLAAARGDLLLILEAMKMEFRLQAPVAGTVELVTASAGAQVGLRQLLVQITPAVC